jgi:hypothetical protein
MGSMNRKRAAAVVTVAASLMIGGVAFAPANAAVVGHPVGDAYAVAVSTISDADQTMANGPGGIPGDVYATVVGVLNDGSRQTDQPMANGPGGIPGDVYATVVHTINDVNR